MGCAHKHVTSDGFCQFCDENVLKFEELCQSCFGYFPLKELGKCEIFGEIKCEGCRDYSGAFTVPEAQ